MGFVQPAEPLQKKKCPHKHRGYIVAGALVAWLSWSIQTHHTPTIDRIEESQAMPDSTSPGTVKLNVGGTTFETTWATLLKCDDTLFHSLQDSNDGRNVFVDWSPVHMERVLMYLRSGYLNRHGLFWWEDDELTRTLSFLKIDAAKCPFTSALEEPKEYDFDNDGVPMTKKPYVCMHGAPGCEGYTLPEQYKPRRPATTKKNSKKSHHISSRKMELINAVRAGAEDLASILQKPNVHVNDHDDLGTTALMVAAQVNNLAAMKVLIEHKCDINRRNHAKQTALFFVQSVEAADLLLTNGININTRDAHRNSAALWAIETDREDVALHLIAKGCELNNRNEANKTLLTCAIVKSMTNVIVAMAKCKDFDIDAHNFAKPMLYAVMAGDVNVATYLINMGCDLNALGHNNTTPLMMAIQSNHLDLAQHLVENGCELNICDDNGKSAFDYTLLHDAAHFAYTLIDHGYNIIQKNKLGESALFIALKHNNKELAKVLIDQLIEQEANLNTKDRQGATALWPAILYTDVEMVEYMLRKGFDPHASTRDGVIPLIFAMRNGKHDIVKHLIDEDGAGDAALWKAAATGELQLVRDLLDYDCDINAQDKDGNTPLMLALNENHEEVALFLLERQCRHDLCNKNGESAIYLALKEERILDILLAKCDTLDYKDANGRTLLMTAFDRNANDETINKLLDRTSKASIAAQDNASALISTCMGRTVLFHAIEQKRIALAKPLLTLMTNLDAQDNTTGDTALILAVKNEEEMVLPLINAGANVNLPNFRRQTPLLLACSKDGISTATTTALIDAGSDLNIQSDDGSTPLMLALQHSVATAELLINNPACDVNKQDAKGQTALFHVKDEKLATMLLKRDCNVNAVDHEGRTPLMTSFGSGALGIAKILIDGGGDLLATGKNGQTILGNAAASGDVEVIQLLLDASCDINAQDFSSNGYTPLISALSNNNEKVALLLLEKECDVQVLTTLGQSALFFATPLTVPILIKRGCEPNLQDKRKKTALLELLTHRRAESVTALIKCGCNLLVHDERNWTALHYVAKYFDDQEATKVAAQFIDKGVDKDKLDSDNNSALLIALANNHPLLARFLIEKDVKVTLANKKNETALNFALNAKDNELAKLLIEKSELNNQTQKSKKTPLMIAVENGMFDAAKAIVERNEVKLADSEEKLKRCDLNLADSEGRTVLIYIVQQNAESFLDFLFDMECDIDLNAQTHDGSTALMIAVENEKISIAQKLVSHRCDASLQNHSGVTALSMIEESGSPDLLKLLDTLKSTDLVFGDTIELLASVPSADGKSISIPLGFLPWKNGGFPLPTTPHNTSLEQVLVLPTPEMHESNKKKDAFLPARFVITPRHDDKDIKIGKSSLKYKQPFVLELAPETISLWQPNEKAKFSLNNKTPSNSVLSIQKRDIKRQDSTLPAKGEIFVEVTKPKQRAKAPVRNGDEGVSIHVTDGNRLSTTYNQNWVQLGRSKRKDGIVANIVCCDKAKNALGLKGRRKAKAITFSIHKVDM